jgi:hypothetical protein
MATYLTNMQEYFFKNYGIILESTNEF